MKKCVLLLFLVFLSGCAPSSLSEYRAEGEGHIEKLVDELSQIESASQLEARRLKLKRQFASIVDLMIEAKKFQMKKNNEPDEITMFQLELSNRLKREMIRIYEIEGCVKIMEDIERTGIHRIDLFERKQIK